MQGRAKCTYDDVYAVLVVQRNIKHQDFNSNKI